MKPKYVRAIPIIIMPTGNYRSKPSDVGSTEPIYPIVNPRPLEHPQKMSFTIEDNIIFPIEPTNDSSLAIECAPESQETPPEQRP